MKKVLRGFWTQLWITFVVALMLLALYGSIGRILAPLIELYQDDIEQEISRHLQQPVHIKELKAGWRGVFPLLMLHGLTIGGEQGVRLERLDASLKLGATIFYRQPIFKSLHLQGIHADIKKVGSKQFQLAPEWIITLPEEEEDDPEEDAPAWVDWLELQPSIILDQIHLSLAREQRKDYFYLESLVWRSSGRQRELKADIAFGEYRLRELSVKGFVDGDLWPWNQQSGYISVQAVEQEWGPWFSELVDPQVLAMHHLVAAFDGWVSFRQGELYATHVNVDLEQLEADLNGQPLTYPEGHIEIAGQQQQGDWHLFFKPDVIEPLAITGLSLSQYWLEKQKAWVLEAEQADLGALRQFLQRYQLLPAMADEYLTGVAVEGKAKAIRVSLLRDLISQQWSVDLKTHLEQVSSQSYQGIPAFSGVDAQVHLQPLGGEVRLLDGEMGVLLDSFYDAPWQVHDLHGRFVWRILPNFVQLQLENTVFKLQQNNNLKQWPAAIDLNILLPINDSLQEPQLGLLIGVPETDVGIYSQLVPNIVGEELNQWLAQALVAGSVQQGAFALHTPLLANAPDHSQTIQLNLEFEQGQFNYLPEWPSITQAKGKLQVDLPNVQVQLEHAQTLGGRLTQPAQAHLSAHQESYRLNVQGALAGSSREALQYLQSTPLRTLVGGAMDDWQAEGQHQTHLDVTVFLEAANDDIVVDLKSQLINSHLTLPEVNLTLNNINGPLHYHTETGVNSPELRADIFSGPIVASISSRLADQQMAITVQGQGQASIDALKAWQPLFLFDPIHGQLDYQARLHLQTGAAHSTQIKLNVQSDLVGTEVALPSPMGKTAEQSGFLKVALETGQQMKIHANYQQLASVALEFDAHGLTRGQARLGGEPALLPVEPWLEIRGELANSVAVEPWWEVWQRMQQLMAQAPAPEEAANAELSLIDLQFHTVDAWGMPLGPLAVTGRRGIDAWAFNIDNQVATGDIHIPDQGPLVADLAFLHIPEKPASLVSDPVMEDPFATIDPYSFPEVDVVLGEVFIGGREYGRWKMAGRQSSEGYRLSLEEGEIYGATVLGDVLWKIELEQPHTYLENFTVSSKDAGKIQRGFRLQPFVEAKKMQAEIAVNWAGSPMAFDITKMVGDVKVDLRNGRLVTDEGGALKAFGLLNIGSLSRRLKLDFSDLYSSGMAVDKITASLFFNQGEIVLTEPASLFSPSGKFVTTGHTHLETEALDMRMVVTLPVTGSLPLIAILAGFAPPIAASIFVTERLVGDELARFTSASYDIKGTWSQPEMTLNRAFDNKIEGGEKRSFTQRILGIFGLGD